MIIIEKNGSGVRRNYRRFVTMGVMTIAFIGLIWGAKMIIESNRRVSEGSEIQTEADARNNEIESLANEVVGQMSLEQKVGQMLIIRNEYTEMTPELKQEVAKIQPGGYIVFNVNITTLAGTRQLISDMGDEIETAGTVAMEDGAIVKIPALLSVDQEGGLVQRLQAITDEPPEYVGPMAEIGASGSPDVAYATGKLLAEECKSVGLNVDFAPVTDIFSNPENTVIGERAFGTDKETVAEMAVAVGRGLSESGVVPVYKHFPGHGDTTVDSHSSLPVVTKTLEELEQNEFYPFRKAIEAGAEMMMVAHMALPQVTGDETPASLSPVIISDLLRGKLGFKGLVVADGLDMGALTSNYTNAEIAVKAVEAGADLLLTPVSPLEARDAIMEAVQNGALSEERINESVRRILRLKFVRL